MAGFFIEKLVVSGKGKKPSTVEFSDGLNFIVGPSNTGKSYIIECIDYLFDGLPSAIPLQTVLQHFAASIIRILNA